MRTFTKLIAVLAVSFFSINALNAQCTSTVDEFTQIEDFESGLQLLNNISGDDFDWTLSNTTTGTPTNNTGPTAAYQGDYFLYTETSNPVGTNDVAIVETACLDFDNNTSPWMSFYLHMYQGANSGWSQASSMGQLVVQVTTNPTATNPTWTTLSGGNFNSYNVNSWALFTIDLSSYANQTIKIRFRAQTGTTSGFAQRKAYGDRAIDSVYISDGMEVNKISCPGANDGSMYAEAKFGDEPYSYSWNTGDTTQSISGLSAGTYTVTITDSSNTTKVLVKTLVEPSVPDPDGLTASTNAICENLNNPVTLSIDFVEGDSIYTTTTAIAGDTGSQNTVGSANNWNINGTLPLAADSATFTFYYRGDMEAAAEYVSISSENGTTLGQSEQAGGQCQGSFSSNSFNVSPDSINAWTSDGSMTFTGTPTGMTRYCNAGGGNYFSWRAYITISYPVSQSIPYWFTSACDSVVANAVDSGYTVNVLPTTTTTYYVRFYNPSCDLWGDCDSITVTVDTQPSVVVTPSSAAYCGSSAATLVASGANTYTWLSPTTGLNTSSGATVQASPATTTTYNVRGESAAGCADTASVTVTVTSGPSASITGTNVTCNGGNNGAAAASVTGGTGSINYSWNTGATSSSITGLTAGTYTVTVSDGSSCTDTETITITEPSAIVINIATNNTCNGSSNGSATAFANGGTGTKTFLWSTGSTSNFIFGLAAGTYTVTVTDGNGCTNTENAVITQPSSPLTVSSTSITNVLCFGENTGSVTAAGAGGTPTYTYSWSNGATGATASGLTAGNYTVTVLDAANCFTGAIYTVTQPSSAVSVSITSSTNITCNGGNDGAATASGTGGTGTKTYVWSTGATTATASGLTAGTYTVTTTDANGCTDTDDVILTEPNAVSATFTTSNVSCNGGNDGSATASGTGGSGTYSSFAWTTGSTSATATGLTAGTYTVTVTDNNGCTGTASTTITHPTALSVSATASNVSCFGGSTGSAAASASGGTSGYTYSWSNSGSGATITGLTAGTYTVTATDANGCTETDAVTITQPTLLVASIGTPTNVSCNGGNDGAATASASGGTTSYSYAWSGGGGSTAAATGLTAGTYTVTVTDANGCTDTESVSITQPTAVVVSIGTPTNVSCNGGNNGSATASTTGGTGTITYAWSGGGGSAATASGLTAGTYTVTATDANGCTDTESVTITQPTAVAVSISSTNSSCNGGANGTATASGSGGTGTITYAWSNGGTAAAISGLTAGTYTVTATDANGCTDSDDITITEPTAVVASIGTPTNVSCNGGSDGAATASATGGTGTKTFVWSTGATTATASSLAAGTYTVTATDANGCTDTESVTITEPTVLVASIGTPTNVSCNGGNDGAATASASGGTTSYSYAWSGGGGSAAAATGLTAGTYTVTVTDANGCTDTESVSITEPTAVVASIGTPTNVSCNGGNDGSATASATGGTGTITYAWSGGGGSAATASGLTAGTYTVTATDANGCTDTESVTITQPTAVAVSISSTNSSCNGGANGTATASGSGGTGTITYAWSNGGTAAAISGLTAGTYTVTATDANGCTDSTSVTITEPTLLVAAASVDDNVSCNGGNDGEATASAMGGTTAYTYAWSNAATTANITGLAAGTYSVTVTDANGCTDSASVTITEPAVLVAATAVDDNVSCNGGNDGEATASATGGTTTYSFAWSSGATSATASNLAAGTYTVTVTDANGCTDTETVTITEPTPVVASAVVDDNVSCNGGNDGEATASASGGTAGYTFSWSGGGGSAATATGLTAGTYIVTVTDANGCEDTASVTITEPTLLVASAVVDDNVSCNGGNDGEATASATGGTTAYTYAWSNAATSATITGLTAGTYSVTVTDANGCTDSTSITITEPAALVAATVLDSNVSCNGGSDGGATASATGGTTAYTYAWSNGATTASITGVAAGTYSVTITDANGCTDSASVSITEPTVLVAATTVDDNVSCNGGNDGEATASATGGTAAYTYAWSSGAATATATGLAAGTFTVTVTDANGCTDTETVTITQPTPLVSATVVDSNVSCNGFNDGGATASATGGTTSYTYAWSNSASTASITGLTAGTYSVTITDANGCTDSTSVSITEPTTLVASAAVDNNVSCNGGNNGQATASATGGTTSYNYAWSSGAATATATGLSAGTYIVTITDANGCVDTASVTITEPNVLNVSTTVTNVSCNGANDGTATAAASGGTSGYTYVWTTGATNATATNLGPGTYGVTATDANGCTSTSSATITQPAVLVAATAVDDNVSCNGGNDGEATASATGGTTAYTYAWSSGATSATASNLTAGTYTVTVTDANGCTDTETVTITEPTPVVASAVVGDNVSCNGGNDGEAAASASGGTAGYTFSWSGGGGSAATATGLTAGTYIVTVTDANGCEDTASVTITEPTLLVASAVVDDNVSCNGGNDGEATASATGGTSTYSYSWSNAATTANITGLTAGTYSVTVTDANGCTDSTSVTITEPTLLVAAASVDDNVSCNGGNDGEATASATGGTTTYTYAWSNAATTANITGLAAGTYSVTVTDANGCTDSASVTITEPAVLVAATAVDDNVSCNGGNDGVATASATGGTTAYTYAWSTSATTATATGLSAGTVTVTVTDANGCTDTETVTITEPTPVVASATLISNVLCNGDSNGIAFAAGSGGTSPYTYAWDNNNTNDTASNLSAGTWGVEVMDANGCIDSAFITVTEPDSLIIVLDSITDVSCNGQSNGAVSATAMGGTTAYTYTWSNGGSSANITGIIAGTYGLTVTDANGCIDTNAYVVNEPDTISNTFAISNVSCNSGNDAYMISTPSGGTAGYTFLWNTGATADSIGGLIAATYTVTITDTNGCQNVFTDSISQPDSLFATIILEDSALCAGDSSGMAIAAATGGTTPYTFNWPTGFTAANDSLIGLPAGNYVVTIVDANGCIDSATATIEQPQVLALSIDSMVDVTCEGGANGFALLGAAGGTIPYSYQWENGGTSSSNANLSAGSTIVTVTDANGCFDTITVTLGETFPLPIIDLGNDTIVCGAVYSLGAGAATSYLWSTGDTTQFINVDSSGYYSVLAGDTNGCANSDTVLVVFNPLLAYSIDTDSSDCGLSTGSAEITNLVGGGNFSISWSTGQTSGLVANNLSSGNYDVTVTDQNGCEEVQSFTIVDGNGITSSVVSIDASCNGGNDGIAVAQGIGGALPYSYNWSNGDVSDTATNLIAGMYLVTVEDANGCSTIDTAMIGEPDAVIVYASSIDADCGDSNGVAMVDSVSPAGVYTYLWSDAQAQTTATADTLMPGVYTVTATSIDGCVGTATVIVSNDTAATLALSTTNASCSNEIVGSGEAIVVATGVSPFTYNWSNGDTTDTAANLMAGLYYLTVADSNGCVEITSVTIGFDNSSPAIDLGDDQEVCGSVTGIGVASGFETYAWNTLDSTSNILVSTAGTYSVTVTDTNGCSSVDSINVDFFNNIIVSSTVIDADCGASNGEISLTVTNGSGNYDYAWSTGDTTSGLTGLAAGTYVVTTTDTTGCSSIDSIDVLQSGAPIVTIATVEPLCADGTDGEASATVTGGQSPYTYAWSAGSIIANQTGLGVGTYDLTVTDNAGCEVIEGFNVNGPAPIVISISSIEPSCADTNGTALATVTGNQGPLTYLWSDAAATDSMFVDSLMAGVYTITVTDSAGCTASESIILNNDGAPILVLGSTDNNCSNEETGSAFVIPFGLATPFTYNWNDALAQTNDTAVNLGVGQYMVTVTDTNGCASIGMTTVGSFNQAPIVSLGDDVSACEGSEVILTPGGQYASYTWSTGDNTPSITATAIQSYDVFVVDVNGCSGSDTVNVNFVTPPVVNLGPDTIVCAEDAGGSLVLDAGSFSNYAWSTSESTQTIEVTSDGVYSVTVSNAPECFGSDDIIVVFDNCINVSAEELEDAANASMNIYPNPNRGLFFLELDGLGAGNYKMQLVNMNGQIVKNEMINIQSGVLSRNEVDLRTIESGVYLIVVEGDSIRMDGRVIIQ